MNWNTYQISDHEFENLTSQNEPIPIPTGDITPNAGVEVYTLTGKRTNGIYDSSIGAIRQLNGYNPEFKTMENRDLLLYNDHLLNPSINTLVVDGFFGTGKTSTVCSHLVDGLKKELEGGKGIPVAYLSKPHEGVGNSYGHLPGDLKEKTAEEFVSFTQYFDRFGQYGFADFLMAANVEQEIKFVKEKQKELPEPMLHLLVFEYLRGRDINKGWIILDEAQNTNNKEISTFISRTSDEAKVIIIGDSTPTQIDKRGNDTNNNGLQFSKDTYLGKKYTGYVEMQTIRHILRGRRVKDLFKALKDVN